MTDNNTLLNLRISYIEYFYMTARMQSFSKAAEVMNISQPSISEAVKKLEAALGVPLIDRKNRTFKLTSFGQAFYEHASVLHNEFVKLQGRYKEMIGEAITHIHLGSCVLQSQVLEPVYRFLDAYPKYSLSLESRNMSVMSTLLEKGYFDLAVMPSDGLTPALTGIPLPAVEFGVSLPDGHPLQSYSTLPARILSGETIIMPEFESSIYASVGSYFEKHCPEATLLYNTPAKNSQELHYLISEGKGVGLFLAVSGKKMGLSPVCTRPLDPPLKVAFSLAWRKDQYLTEPMKALISTLEQSSELQP